MPDPKDCPNPECHGNPFRYCPTCSWIEEPEVHPLRRYFSYRHLPEPLQAISAGFAELASQVDAQVANGTEKDAGMRKLLEAKDCFVRAALPPAPAYPLIPKD